MTITEFMCSMSVVCLAHQVMMTERPISRRNKYGFLSDRSTFNDGEFLEITLIYNNTDHTVKIPQGAGRMTICSEIKRQTGVKGAFYLFNGDKFYLHSSSLTLSNINKVLGSKLEVRGGDCKCGLVCFLCKRARTRGWTQENHAKRNTRQRTRYVSNGGSASLRTSVIHAHHIYAFIIFLVLMFSRKNISIMIKFVSEFNLNLQIKSW